MGHRLIAVNATRHHQGQQRLIAGHHPIEPSAFRDFLHLIERTPLDVVPAGIGVDQEVVIRRPIESVVLINPWAITPSSDSDNERRTLSCSSGGYMPRTRSTVFTAELVCRVTNTRWPVWAASRAVERVS